MLIYLVFGSLLGDFPWIWVGFEVELEASVLPVEEVEVTEDTESECSVSVSSLV